jgi:hypothetical protein
MAKIDIPREFNNLADDLGRAVDRGRILHETKNIRDSGVPFEHLFRKIIGSRLPEPYRMRTGFLFDGQSNVTPQIDAVIVDTTTSHEIFTSEEGAGYLPYASASVVFEIKNSLLDPAKSIEQIDATRAWRHSPCRRCRLPMHATNTVICSAALARRAIRFGLRSSGTAWPSGTAAPSGAR